MGAINEDSQWVYFPIRGNKAQTKVCEDTVVFHSPLYCPKRKKEIKIDVVQLKIVASE